MPGAPENPGLDRTRYELRAAGVRDAARNPLRSGVHTRGYLTHVKREGAEYFVTFRLGDSLPKRVLQQYEGERAERLRAIDLAKTSGGATPDTPELAHRDFLRRVERFLDQGAGACHLRQPEIADLVADALRFFDGERYLLREWVVMPNHVHALVWPMPNHLLGDIVKTWKQFTSLRAKRALGQAAGIFWQREAFDHWVRDDRERARIARYIRNNPVKAGLCAQPADWRWGSAFRVEP
jgi:REP element-mobilizing transposase RayT